MYKIKFNDVTLISNKKKIQKNNTIFFFYGIGCCSDDFKFLFKSINKKYQLIIPELPGHNYEFKKTNYGLENFTKNIFLLIKKTNLQKITFFTHSVGGIIPILLAKKYLKKRNFKMFINYEGNLTFYDTSTVTRKTILYKKNEFHQKFKKLINLCENSNDIALNKWSESLKKTSSQAFYDISADAVFFSRSDKLLKFFRSFFSKKIYLYGSKSKLFFSEFLFGSIRYKIYDCGHFSFYENKVKFRNFFNKLIIERKLKND
ncbi:MAG: hypothetical protein CL572_03240 [Alphaproteobacteria bacterium]|nr:hypothetical protein [Alphaproteobacteria bacterium]